MRMQQTLMGVGGDVAPGTYIPGYQRKEFWQAQVSVIQFFDRVLGASRLALVG